MNRGMKESGKRADEEEQKKCNKDPASNEKRKEEKENERNKEKEKRKIENEEIYKGRNTHSPLPHCTRI